jgi:hypothetical protein
VEHCDPSCRGKADEFTIGQLGSGERPWIPPHQCLYGADRGICDHDHVAIICCSLHQRGRRHPAPHRLFGRAQV